MLLVGGPWYIKNLILTGNPTYPLLGSVFPSNRTEKQNQQWSAAHRPPADRSAIEDAWKHAGLLAGLYKWASPLLVPFLALSLLCKRRFCWWLLGFLGYCFLLWLLVTHRLERFLLPFYPVAAILAGSSVVWQQGPFWQRMVAAVLLVGVLINLPFAASRLVGDVRFFAPLKDLDGRSTTARDYEHPDGAILPLNHLSPKMAWLNENHPDSKVLFFGECRPLTAEFPVIYNTCFDQCETWKRVHGRSPREIRDLFAREEIEFLLVNFSEWTRMKQTYGYNVEDEGKPIEPGDILALDGKAWRRMKDLDEKFPGNPSVWVFRLLPPQDTGRPDAFSGQPAESP